MKNAMVAAGFVFETAGGVYELGSAASDSTLRPQFDLDLSIFGNCGGIDNRLTLEST